MTNLDSIIQLATQAMCEQNFGDADAVLQRGLQSCDDLEEREIILQHLVHLYEHPLNENLDKAQAYMSERESLHPSAYTALANAYFQLHSKRDSHAARNWAEIASRRALEEHDLSTLYSASAVGGRLAARDGDRVAAEAALRQIEILLGSADEMICYGDAVAFLELLGKTGDMAAKARRLAGLIAPKIEDVDFRARAETVAGLQSQ
jgi:hypothetical protein